MNWAENQATEGKRNEEMPASQTSIVILKVQKDKVKLLSMKKIGSEVDSRNYSFKEF